MRVVVLVPRRQDRGHRDRVWEWVAQRWADEHPDWPVYEGHHQAGPFNRSAAINAAADAAGAWDVAVIVDSDVIVAGDQLRQAVTLANQTGSLVLAYDRFMYLDQRMSERIMGGYVGWWEPGVQWSMTTTCSSAVVVSRPLWHEVGGFDESFEGWGFEDVGFFDACHTLAGSRRVQGPVWHLWHPPSMENNQTTPEYQASLARCNRYGAAFEDPDAMRRLLREEREAPVVMPSIPRLIHRVWLGPNTPTRPWLTAEWERVMPGWDVIHWDDQNVEERLGIHDHWLYRDAPTYVHRADLVMVATVQQYGGLAVGWDVEPLRNMDHLAPPRSEAWCTPDADGFPGGALFATKAGHPSMAALLHGAEVRITRDGWHPAGPHIDTGPHLWHEVLGTDGNGLIDVVGRISDVYPVPYWHRTLLADRPAAIEHARRIGACAIHWFDHSWFNPDDVKVR